MAMNMRFAGMNRQFQNKMPRPMEDHFNGLPDQFAYSNGVWTWSKWRLTPEELEEINRTGEIWLFQRDGACGMRPTILGSFSWVKMRAVDFGRMFRPKSRETLRLPSPPKDA